MQHFQTQLKYAAEQNFKKQHKSHSSYNKIQLLYKWSLLPYKPQVS